MSNQDTPIASAFEKLQTHDRPVNRMAVIVGFASGQHFDPDFSRRTKSKATMVAPPRAPVRPDHEIDYTGKRRGSVVCAFWFKKTRVGNGAVWVVRCDCGNYEFRERPGRWDISHQKPNDACEECVRKREMLSRYGGQNRMGYTSHQTAGERTLRFIERLKSMGLTLEEITEIRHLNLDAKGSVDDIRKRLSEAKGELHA